MTHPHHQQGHARKIAASGKPQQTSLALLRAMRPLHWLKNCFVLAPLLFSRAFHQPEAVQSALWAFLAFCLAASAVYLWNDLRDLEVDRLHPGRRHRPLASGALSARAALIAILVLAIATVATVLQIPAIGPYVAVYSLINVAYSLGLKRIPWVDLAILTAGFLLRVYAGAAAIDVHLSIWMATATFSLALYLASWKRHAELVSHGAKARPALAFYQVTHLRAIALLAGAAALGCYLLFTILIRPILWPTLIPISAGMARYGWLALYRAEGASPFAAIIRDPWLLVITILWAGGTLFALW